MMGQLFISTIPKSKLSFLLTPLQWPVTEKPNQTLKCFVEHCPLGVTLMLTASQVLEVRWTVPLVSVGWQSLKTRRHWGRGTCPRSKVKLTEILSGFWKLAWTRFKKVAMWFPSITEMENINCGYFGNINMVCVNNGLCSAFCHLILHFAVSLQIPSVGQNTKHWCKLMMLWFLVFVFLFICLGYFWCV